MAGSEELQAVVETFRKWLSLPDPSPLIIFLAALVANLMPGDPLWLLLVGPSSSGKSEIINTARSLPYVHPVSILTEAALLSGTSARDNTAEAKGGLLSEIGDFGIVLLKDFTSVLSMHRDMRARVLAAFREIYDGHWDRRVGTDGGLKLSWSGKVGLIGGCTAHIDQHHAVMATMGERFVLFRMPKVRGDLQAMKALSVAGQEAQMRSELSDAVTSFLSRLNLPKVPPKLQDQKPIVALATLVARCRSPVERDSYTRQIEMIPDPEVPIRLSRVLAQLWVALGVLGVDPDRAKRLLTKVGLGSMPQVRRQVFEVLWTAESEFVTTADVASNLGLPEQTVRRALEDLEAHAVVVGSQRGQGKTNAWKLSQWTRQRMTEAGVSFP